MNPLTLDCLRRWKWLLLGQFLVVTVAWFYHARLHLEVIGILAMVSDLLLGSARTQLGLPQRRRTIAAGMWLSAVGLGVAVQSAGMLLGGAVLAPMLRSHTIDREVLGLHTVFCILISGAAQYLLTGLRGVPTRTLAGQVKGGVFGALWGASMFGAMWIGFYAPVSRTAVAPMHCCIMVLLGVMSVASWFTTRRMVVERAMPSQEAALSKRSTDLEFLFAGAQGWRLRIQHEVLCLVPAMLGSLVAAVVLIAIDDLPKEGAAKGSREWMYQYRSLGLLCTISVFPVIQMAAASLRAVRSLPMLLTQCSLMLALRPFMAGLAVFVVYSLLNWVIGRGTDMEGRALAVYLPLCSLTSLIQAVILRYPRIPIVFALLIAFSLVSAWVPDVMRQPFPSIGLLMLNAVLLVISWRLHVRWLGKSSQVYQLNQGFLRMAGGPQR